MSNNKRVYPERFKIIKNNNGVLEVEIKDLIKGEDEYYVKQSINGKKQREKKKFITPSIINFDVSQAGKHTFTIYINRPNNRNIDKFKVPVWEQDVYVPEKYIAGLNKSKINKLAGKYAPFVFLDDEERFLPTSIDYLLNRDSNTGNIIDKGVNLSIKLEFPKKRRKDKSHPNKPRQLIGAKIDDIDVLYNDLGRVLSFNGDKDSKLHTITKVFGNGIRAKLENRKGRTEHLTVYYSAIQNINKNQLIINYHFLYTYDPKGEDYGDGMKIGSHVFDRESVNVVFDLGANRPISINNIKPIFIIYGAHLEKQTMGLIKSKSDTTSLQKWKKGRVKVHWDDAIKIKKRPVVFAALGSHAVYPHSGYYAVYYFRKVRVLKEPARCGKILIPNIVSYDNNNMVELFDDKKENVYSYSLKDLEIDRITSNSWNGMLAFSGGLVDIIVGADAKFPPYTSRELDCDNWVNKKFIKMWDAAKVDKKFKDDQEDLIKKIEKVLI